MRYLSCNICAATKVEAEAAEADRQTGDFFGSLLFCVCVCCVCDDGLVSALNNAQAPLFSLSLSLCVSVSFVAGNRERVSGTIVSI